MGLRSWGHGTLVAEWREWTDPATGDGALIPGTVTVQNPLRITIAADDAIIPAGKIVSNQPLNTAEDEALADGKSINIVLPATDDTDLEQEHPGYTVTVNLANYGTETYTGVKIPEGGTTNLRALLPAVKANIPTASLSLSQFARIQDGLIVDADGNPLTTGGGSVAFIEDPAAPGLFQVGA